MEGVRFEERAKIINNGREKFIKSLYFFIIVIYLKV